MSLQITSGALKLVYRALRIGGVGVSQKTVLEDSAVQEVLDVNRLSSRALVGDFGHLGSGWFYGLFDVQTVTNGSAIASFDPYEPANSAGQYPVNRTDIDVWLAGFFNPEFISGGTDLEESGFLMICNPNSEGPNADASGGAVTDNPPMLFGLWGSTGDQSIDHPFHVNNPGASGRGRARGTAVPGFTRVGLRLPRGCTLNFQVRGATAQRAKLTCVLGLAPIGMVPDIVI